MDERGPVKGSVLEYTMDMVKLTPSYLTLWELPLTVECRSRSTPQPAGCAQLQLHRATRPTTSAAKSARTAPKRTNYHVHPNDAASSSCLMVKYSCPCGTRVPYTRSLAQQHVSPNVRGWMARPAHKRQSWPHPLQLCRYPFMLAISACANNTPKHEA